MPYYNPDRYPNDLPAFCVLNYDVNLQPKTHAEWVIECEKLKQVKIECINQYTSAKKQRDEIVEQWKQYVRNIRTYKLQLDKVPTPLNPSQPLNCGQFQSEEQEAAFEKEVLQDSTDPENGNG